MKNMIAKYNKTNILQYFFLIGITWLLFAFLIFPNLNLIVETFTKDGNFTTSAIDRLIKSDRAMRSLRNSFILAVTLSITVNVLGTFIVLISDYFKIKGSKILKIGYSSTLVYGGIALASGYLFVYGDSGVITKILISLFPNLSPHWFEGYGAVTFVMTFALTSYHIIFLSDALKNIDYQTIEAAKSMGASTWSILAKVVLPVLRPNYFAITILIILTGLGATSAPLMIGGESFQTINPMIIRFSKSIASRDIATVLSLVLGLATILILFISKKIESRYNYMSVSKVKTLLIKQKIENPVLNLLIHIIAYFIFAIYIMPILLIFIYSFTDGYTIATGNINIESFTLENYTSLLLQPSSYKPYLTSITYSALAAFIVGSLILVLARYIRSGKSRYRNIIDYALMTPWLLPSTLIAMGLIVTYDTKRLLLFGQVLTGTTIMLLVGYIIIKIPFTLRMTNAALYNVDHSLEEAAQSMGANKFYIFRKIVFPVIRPFILAIFVLNFNSLLADYDLSVLLYHPLYEPLGIVIKNNAESQINPNAQALVLVYSVILMVISTISLVSVYSKQKKVI
ncbi:ABC transporter permease [Alkaliphilus peptidifermentans]|uniref:Iron(III) transport system permease protein n=1 Tax=Alkaliphilus peptidifermentans DSM 18978 TaxID=1120976 RepID=A0A1G5L5C4_9FIRM|nr:iron ABC transporter permease [Alkaliphilus peptidifermentans]SCZ07651.1 iron(III) transport system permease protein [Alkaliphilus peptidifermentans DSM 18978]